MDKIVLSFFYKGQVLHVTESGKILRSDGSEAKNMKARVDIGIDGTGAAGYQVYLYDGDKKITDVATSY